MAVLPILKYPHPILRQVCAPVEAVDDSLRALVQDMVDTLYDGPGAVGLAAPQVGYAVRVVVIDISAASTRDQLKVLINPELVQVSRNKMVREGCLSFPEYLANIRRGTRAVVRALNELGETVEYDTRKLEAIAVQHEIDHLDGVLLLDRINSLKTDLIRRADLMGPRDGGESR